MAKKKNSKKHTVKFPQLDPRDFNTIPDHECFFIKPQSDNTIVGLYRSNSLRDFHWLVVRGDTYYRFDSLAEARDYCKRKHYDI